MTHSSSPARQELFSIDQIAVRGGVSPKTVRRLITEQELHAHKIKGQYRISEEDWRAYLAAQRR